jgi:hypothetical protein
MAAVWLFVRSPDSARAQVLAAFLVGCAMGLKLTFAVFGIAFMAACAVSAWKPRRLVASFAALVVGFALFGGYWAWILWREFANPVFPYYNLVFRSPWWEPSAFFDPARGPQTLGQAILLPFYFGLKSTLVSEIAFRDYRLPVLYVLGVAVAIKVVATRPVRDKRWTFLVAFALAAYVAWLCVFSIFRYLVPLELISGALIVGAIRFLVRERGMRYAVVGILTVLLIGTTRTMSWGRIPFGPEYFEVALPPVEPKSLVIVGYVHPLAYLIPWFPPDTRFVSPANNFMLLDQPNLLEKRAGDLIRSHPGAIYLLEHRQRLPQDTWTADRFALEFGECQPIKAAMSANEPQLCRMRRR